MTEPTQGDVVWLTQAKYEDLQAELENLRGPGRADVAVKPRSSDVSASCLLRAFSADHSVVGELNFKVAGESGTTLRKVTLRTEREATSVELIGCTTADQRRPR